MFDVRRWLRVALTRAKQSNHKTDFYQLCIALSDRLEELGERFKFTTQSDILITSRFEQAEVPIKWEDGTIENIFLCIEPYVPKCATLVFPPLGRRAVA